MKIPSRLRRLFHTEKPPIERSPEPDPRGLEERYNEFKKGQDRIKQMLAEMETSKSILDNEPQREEAARVAIRKIVLSDALPRTLMLRHTESDLSKVYLNFVESLRTASEEKKIPLLVDKTFELVKVASQMAGRLSEPYTAVEGTILLGDILRDDGIQILDKVAEDPEGTSCEILCGTTGCDSVETVRLSKQSLEDIRAKRAIYRCPLHRS
jgi:hypothetical protein